MLHFLCLWPKGGDDRAKGQAADVGPAENAVVHQADAVVPERPSHIAGRRTLWTGSSHHGDCPQSLWESHNHQRGECSDAALDDEQRDAYVHRGDRHLIQYTRAVWTEDYRQSTMAVGAVKFELVDVLAREDRHHAQSVWDGDPERL